MDIKYPYTFDLQVLNKSRSNWMVLFSFLGGLALSVPVVIFLLNFIDYKFGLILAYLIVFIILFFRYFYLVQVKFRCSISFYDSHMQVDETKIDWENIEWFQTNIGSAFLLGLHIGTYSNNKIKTYVSLKQGDNLDNYIEMIELFEVIIKEKAIPVRNYYSSKFFRTLANISILSNLIPLFLYTVLAFDSSLAMAIFFIWMFISLLYTLLIYLNQD